MATQNPFLEQFVEALMKASAEKAIGSHFGQNAVESQAKRSPLPELLNEQTEVVRQALGPSAGDIVSALASDFRSNEPPQNFELGADGNETVFGKMVLGATIEPLDFLGS